MLYRMFWISVVVMMTVVGSVTNAFAQGGGANFCQAEPGLSSVIPNSHAEDTIYTLCGTNCPVAGDPDSCQTWVPGTGSQQVCQAKKFCSVNAEGEQSCTSWWVELDLGELTVTGFTTQRGDRGPIEPAPGERYQVIAEAEMSARVQPNQVRRTYDTGSPVDLQLYQHIYAADNYFMWLLCEVDAQGNDTSCDVIQP